MTDRDKIKFPYVIFLCAVVLLLGVAAFWSTVAYIIFHFINKFW